MGSRIIYGMASQQLAPAALAHIAAKTQTPVRATVLLGVIIWLFAVWLPLVTLAKITSFVIIIVFSLVNFSLAMIYWRETGSSRIKALIPLFGGALCLFLLALQSIDVFS
jgi:amino acid transporter